MGEPQIGNYLYFFKEFDMKKVIVLLLMVLFLNKYCFAAEDKYFYESGQIVDGDIYGWVYLKNDGTVVNMTGGQIERVSLSDNSNFNMSGGKIIGYSINAFNESYFEISNGIIEISEFVLYGSGGKISGGNISANRLKTTIDSLTQIENGILNFNSFDIYGNMDIKGGTINISDFYTHYYSRMNIFAGNIEIDDILFDPSAIMNVYSNNYNYNATQKTLTCYLNNGGYLNIANLEQVEYNRINFIPEPSVLSLLSMGILVIKRKYFKKTDITI